MDFHPSKDDRFIMYFHEPRDTWKLDHTWLINSCLKRVLLSWGTRRSWKSANKITWSKISRSKIAWPKITWSKIISRFPTHFPGTLTHENAGNVTKINNAKQVNPYRRHAKQHAGKLEVRTKDVCKTYPTGWPQENDPEVIKSWTTL